MSVVRGQQNGGRSTARCSTAWPPSLERKIPECAGDNRRGFGDDDGIRTGLISAGAVGWTRDQREAVPRGENDDPCPVRHNLHATDHFLFFGDYSLVPRASNALEMLEKKTRGDQLSILPLSVSSSHSVNLSKAWIFLLIVA